VINRRFVHLFVIVIIGVNFVIKVGGLWGGSWRALSMSL